MVAEIRRCLSQQPFVPFTIYSADGAALPVPTVDHAAVSPTGNRVIVFLNDDTTAYLSPLLITRVALEERHS